MESDVDRLNQLASKLFAELNEHRQNGYVLCKLIIMDIMDSDLKKLESRLPIVLTMLEVLLPALELDLNRHHMVHLVAAIRANGPCWVWAMFGFERFWKHLTDWMTQK
ncbi:TPA: hypothetical protein ACH3X1_004252 [Trebouxia sp. C0004]